MIAKQAPKNILKKSLNHILQFLPLDPLDGTLVILSIPTIQARTASRAVARKSVIKETSRDKTFYEFGLIFLENKRW